MEKINRHNLHLEDTQLFEIIHYGVVFLNNSFKNRKFRVVWINKFDNVKVIEDNVNIKN